MIVKSHVLASREQIEKLAHEIFDTLVEREAIPSSWNIYNSDKSRWVVEVCRSIGKDDDETPYTVAIITDRSSPAFEVKYVGVSKRNPVDKQNTDIGIRLALRRAMLSDGMRSTV